MIRAHLLTCPARAAVRRATLRRLAQTDWGEAPRIFYNRSRLEPAWRRTVSGFPRLLRRALAEEGPGYFLVLEDDLFFNRHLRHNLEAWAPLREGRAHFASLYDPGMLRLVEDDAQHLFHAEPTRVMGAQALVLSRACAAHLVARWAEAPLFHHDLRAAVLAAQLGPLLYHTPALVQHARVPSTWGGPPHRALDFDPDFRA